MLGERCLRNLKEVVAKTTYKAPDGYDGGLGTQIVGLWANSSAEEMGCPADIFGTRWDEPTVDMPVLLERELFFFLALCVDSGAN